MEQRVSLITLGVRDVAAAKAFYKRLGWRPALDVEETVFFETGGSIIVLWGREKLERDSGVRDGGSWGGITLAHNVGSAEEVDEVIDEARAAGARISRAPAETFYGGYAGHPWEVAYNPGFALNADGSVHLPPID
jgi:uncharacterized protein